MLIPETQPFSLSQANLPRCRRLRLEADSKALLNELDLSLWPKVSSVAGRYRYYVVGGKGDHSQTEAPQLRQLPAARRFLAGLPGQVIRAHYSVLRPRTRVPVHTDGSRHFETFDRSLRLHIPLTSNARCALLVGDHLYRMRPDEVWMMDNLGIHGAINHSFSRARTHLIVDVVPDAACLELARTPHAEERYDAPRLEREIVRRGGRPEKLLEGLLLPVRAAITGP
jgi:hypothetical protein